MAQTGRPLSNRTISHYEACFALAASSRIWICSQMAPNVSKVWIFEFGFEKRVWVHRLHCTASACFFAESMPYCYIESPLFTCHHCPHLYCFNAAFIFAVFFFFHRHKSSPTSLTSSFPSPSLAHTEWPPQVALLWSDCCKGLFHWGQFEWFQIDTLSVKPFEVRQQLHCSTHHSGSN